MWWGKELEHRRQEVERVRRRLASNMTGNEPVLATVRRTAPNRMGLTLSDGVALAFAAASILGPWRAVRLALFAVSAVRTVRSLTATGSKRP